MRKDYGLEAIELLYSVLQIDDEWSVREPRGFTWWAGDYAQRVWAEPCVEDHGVWLSRLVAETVIVTNAVPERKLQRALAAAQFERPSLSAAIWGSDGAIRLVCTTRAYDQFVEVHTQILSIAMLMQLLQTEVEAEMLAEIMGGRAAASGHPRHGRRPIRDGVLSFVVDVLVPMGKEPSRWLAAIPKACT